MDPGAFAPEPRQPSINKINGMPVHVVVVRSSGGLFTEQSCVGSAIRPHLLTS